MNVAQYDRLNKKTQVQHIHSQLEHKVPVPGTYFHLKKGYTDLTLYIFHATLLYSQ